VRQHGHVRHDDRPRLSFFVYGTLRPGEANHDSLLRGRIESEVPAVLSGAALYDGPGYPYAFDDPDGGRVISRVVGELIEPLPELYDQVLADLDRLEEYVPGRDANLYERVAREVRANGPGTVTAWVYLAGAALERALRADGQRIPGGDWKRR
jgi:gamma-glutamylcyclotransferase (GGCT)/AIG2-like uncharacterized protein YtfP